MNRAEQARDIAERYRLGEITVDEALAEARSAIDAAGSDAAEWGPNGKRVDPLADLLDGLQATVDE